MLARTNRLQGKDVRYMVKKGKPFFTQHYAFYVIPQYLQNDFHQISITISRNVTRSAVARHTLKRKLYGHIERHGYMQQKKTSYKKIFIIINKKSLDGHDPLSSNIDKRVSSFGGEFSFFWNKIYG